MRTQILIQLTVALLLTVSSNSFADVGSSRTIARSEPKKQLNVVTGLYKVTKSASDGEDAFCYPSSEYTVEWLGTDADPVLSLGTVVVFADFNKGLTSSSEPGSENNCTEKSNTQTLSSLLIQDEYSNCKNENTTVHTEVKFKANEIEYKKTTKISKKNKIATITSSCTLKK